MALFLNDKDNRSELQNRVAAELKERLKQKQAVAYDKPEPSILDNQHTTSSTGIIWAIVLVLVVAGLLVYLIRS